MSVDRASIHEVGGRLTAESHENLKPCDIDLQLSNLSGIWQTSQQQVYRLMNKVEALVKYA